MNNTMDALNHALSWVAVKGLSPDQALEALGLEFPEKDDDRDRPDWPDFEDRRDYRDRIFMGQLPAGWLLLFGQLDEEEKDRFTELVRFGPAFVGEIARIGCYAEAHGYEDGQEVWSVDYDYDNRKPSDVLQVEGRLPSDMMAIIDQAKRDEAEGRGSHIGKDVLFEIPGKMSKALCDFSPHEEPPAGFRWSMLQRIGGEPEPESARKPKGCLALLFGWR